MSKARKRYERAWRDAEKLGIASQLAELADRAVRTLGDAESRYDSIRWGQEPDGVLVVEAPSVAPGETLTVLGTLEYVEYSGRKNGPDTLWLHGFKKAKPLLCVNAESRLIVCGGDYRVTERGIVG